MLSNIDFLLKRRSVLANELSEPGPSEEQLQQILQAAHRVPDHGKLGPWRFVVLKGEARAEFGKQTADIYAEDNPEASAKLLEFEQTRFLRAPLVVALISTAQPHPKIPEWEQVLSVGAVGQNMLLAAHALGYAAQWLTEWYSYHHKVDALLDVSNQERIAGFIYIGSMLSRPAERTRPELDERLSYWAASAPQTQ